MWNRVLLQKLLLLQLIRKLPPALYYPPIYAWVFQMVCFCQVSSPEPCMHLCSSLFVPLALIWSPKQYLMRSTHEAPQYAFFSSHLLLPPSPKYRSLSPVFEHCQPVFVPSILETKFHTYTQQEAVLYISNFASRWLNGRQSILNWMSADIPWLQSALNFFMHTVLIC